MICYFPEWYNKLCAARNDGSLSISNSVVYNLLHVSISSTSNRPALNQWVHQKKSNISAVSTYRCIFTVNTV